jgi:hypothetical protein
MPPLYRKAVWLMVLMERAQPDQIRAVRRSQPFEEDGQARNTQVNASTCHSVCMVELKQRKRKTMEPNLGQERQQAHALLDMLPADKLNAVRSLLEVMVEPLPRSLALAPVEEEEITSETAAALDRARTSLARGEGHPARRGPP